MKLFIYGAGGEGKEDYDILMRSKKRNKYSRVYFVDDFQSEANFYGTHRIHFSSCQEYRKNEEAEFIIAVGEPSARKMLFNKVISNGYSLATLIDDTAIISDTANISRGCIIKAGAIISSDAVLQENCLVMYDAIIGHDALVQEHSVICPKATVGGHCIVGEQCFIGIGASIIQKINLGNDVIVGMGAMVFREVTNGSTVVGNPARVTRGNTEHKVF